MNPWGLTQSEEQAMRLLIEAGSQKTAAAEYGCHHKSFCRTIAQATEKMHERTPIRAVVAFDRWERSK